MHYYLWRAGYIPVICVRGSWWSIHSGSCVKQIIEREMLGVISPWKLYTSIHKCNPIGTPRVLFLHPHGGLMFSTVGFSLNRNEKNVADKLLLCPWAHLRDHARFIAPKQIHIFLYLTFFLLERPNLFAIYNNTFSTWCEGWRMSCIRVLSSSPLLVRSSETGGDSRE
jgi:hypothetical protein